MSILLSYIRPSATQTYRMISRVMLFVRNEYLFSIGILPFYAFAKSDWKNEDLRRTSNVVLKVIFITRKANRCLCQIKPR